MIDERVQNGSISQTFVPQQVLDCLRILPSKSYGDTSVSDNANAIIGDVIQFYNSSSNTEQHKILQDLQKRVEELCQRQDDRDARFLHLSELMMRSMAAKGSNDGKQQIDLLAVIANLQVERQPEDVLQECEAIAMARQFLPDQCVDATSYLADLEIWACSNTSALLLVQAESMAEDATKDSAIAITQYLREAALPVAWHFSDPQALSAGVSLGLATVLQSLIIQLIRLSPEPPRCEITCKAANEEGQSISEAQLIDLFRTMASKLPRCILIVEAPSQNEADPSSNQCAQRLANIFTDTAQQAHQEGRAFKILMIHQNPITLAERADADFNPTRATFVLATPTPLARARLQAIRMQNGLLSILEKIVLVAD